MKRSDPAATRRLILLGASNLTRGLATATANAHAIWRQPLEILAAGGNGRSYGSDSTFLGRQLPGILQCGLWPEIGQRPPCPTVAVVTDIGNDLLYGTSPPQLAAWIAECLDRLAQWDSRVIVTRLPTVSVAKISPYWYALLRRLFFPGSRMGLSEALAAAHEVNALLNRFQARQGVTLMTPQPSWYGLDPIHIRHGRQSQAWHTMLGAIEANSAPGSHGAARLSPGRRWAIRFSRPQTYRLWQIPRHAPQPTQYFREGTTLSLY